MSIEVTCSQCGKTLKAKDEHVGLKAKCSQCGAIVDIRLPIPAHSAVAEQISIKDLRQALEEDRVGNDREATLTDVWKVLNTISSSLSKVPTGGIPQREYKVITQKDKWFSGKFDPEKVEGALNSYAKQGWVLRGVATASVPGFGGQRDEIVIIMER